MRTFLIAAALSAGVAATALAATEKPAAPSGRACFSSSEWKGWKAKDSHTMYLRVGVRDVYEVGFQTGCRANGPGAILVTVFRGSSTVCSPIDLDIKVADAQLATPTMPCIASSLRKLSPEEAVALPKQYQP